MGQDTTGNGHLRLVGMLAGTGSGKIPKSSHSSKFLMAEYRIDKSERTVHIRLDIVSILIGTVKKGCGWPRVGSEVEALS